MQSASKLSILVSVIFDLSETHKLSSSFSMVFSLYNIHTSYSGNIPVFDGKNHTGWWFGTWILFFHSVGNVIIPTDELICFRGVGSTTNQYRTPHRCQLKKTIASGRMSVERWRLRRRSLRWSGCETFRQMGWWHMEMTYPLVAKKITIFHG